MIIRISGFYLKLISFLDHYLINTLLYHRLVRFPTSRHKFCAKILNNIKFFLECVDFLSKTLQSTNTHTHKPNNMKVRNNISEHIIIRVYIFYIS